MPRAPKAQVDESAWVPSSDSRNSGKFTCIICKDNKWRKKNDRESHENSQKHLANIRNTPRNLQANAQEWLPVHARISEVVRDIIANPHPLPSIPPHAHAGTSFGSESRSPPPSEADDPRAEFICIQRHLMVTTGDGRDYSAKWDKWFENKHAELGTEMSGPAWKAYIKELTKRDEERWPGTADEGLGTETSGGANNELLALETAGGTAGPASFLGFPDYNP